MFGGTFDPIHNAHLDIGRAAVEQANLDRLLFVVAGEPPHKRDATFAPAEDRFHLVEAALANEPHMEASRIELDRDGPSYTVETLGQLNELHPEASLFLVLGMDALIDLPCWRDSNRILSLARLLVVPRPGNWVIPSLVRGFFDMLQFDQTEISSTEVRRRIVAGESLAPILPLAVHRLIEQKGIYRSCPVDATGDEANA